LEFLESFLDEGKLIDAPIKWKYSHDAIKLFQKLPAEVRAGLPAHIIAYLFKPKSKQYKWLLDHTDDLDLWQNFRSLSMLHESTRMQTCGAAERLIEMAWGSAAIKARDVGFGPSWKRLIDEKWIVITKGGHGVSKSATTAVIRARNTEILHYMRNR